MVGTKVEDMWCHQFKRYNLAKTLGVLVAQNLSQGVEQKGEWSLYDLI